MRRPPLPVLAEGDGWVVVAKPPRLIVHRNEHNPRAYAALQRVRDQVGSRVYAVHRLDAAASGCLLLATDRERVAGLAEALAEGRKTYLALVRGVCGEPSEIVETRPIKDDNGRIKDARTELRVVARCAKPRSSVVVARPFTGRYHQIRRHLAGRSHPIIGDSSHGDTKVNRWWREQGGILRLALHCMTLSLDIPGHGQLDVSCPLFQDMAHALAALSSWRVAVAAVPGLAAAPLPLAEDFQPRP